MAKKYIRTTMGIFTEDDNAKGSKCTHCRRHIQEQPVHCRNVSELMEMAHVIAEERSGKDNCEALVVDVRVACGLMRSGYTKPRY